MRYPVSVNPGRRADQSERFKQTLAEIRHRWGSDALRPLSAVRNTSTHIPTGFPALDALLAGGIPCGQAVELCGVPTSGATTLALRSMAEAQAQGRLVVYVDLARVFDPGYAVRCGVRMDGLLIARPEEAADGVDILTVVAAEAGAALAVLDSTAELLASPDSAARLRISLRKLAPALRRSGCTTLFLSSDTSSQAMSHQVGLRLVVENTGWVEQGRDIAGLHARVIVTRNTRGRADQETEIVIALDDLARGDAA